MGAVRLSVVFKTSSILCDKRSRWLVRTHWLAYRRAVRTNPVAAQSTLVRKLGLVRRKIGTPRPHASISVAGRGHFRDIDQETRGAYGALFCDIDWGPHSALVSSFYPSIGKGRFGDLATSIARKAHIEFVIYANYYVSNVRDTRPTAQLITLIAGATDIMPDNGYQTQHRDPS